MTEEKLVRAYIIDGSAYVLVEDGSLRPTEGKTDFEELKRQVDAGVEPALDDPDNLPMTDEEWEAAPASPVRRSVRLAVDNDLLTWFRSRGPDLDGQVNSALRSFVESRKRVG